MLQESKFLKKKLKEMEERTVKSEEVYARKTDFTKKLEERYNQVCSEVEATPTIEIDWGEIVTFKRVGGTPIVPVKQPKMEKISQIWTNDHPDKFEIILNKNHFNSLKGKVRALKKGQKIREKKHAKVMASLAKKKEKLEAEIPKLDEGIEEKEKEYELLITQLQLSKKGVKYGTLLPLENIIKAQELKNSFKDEKGDIILKLGTCEKLMKGDKLITRN